jgi:protein-S-isoprenylcysteine O-methyltransferase Ste14
VISLARHHEALLKDHLSKRSIQEGQASADTVIAVLLFVACLGEIVFIPLDVFWLRLMSEPGTVASTIGLILFAAGCWMMYKAVSENSLAVSGVRHQADRQRIVIDSGVYGTLRHPMYAAGILIAIGMALWLESYTAVLTAIVPVALLIVRIAIEEAALRRELSGYEDYMKRVPYRLIPFVW